MESFKQWLRELADQEIRLGKQDKVIEKPIRGDGNNISPWHQQRKMKKH
jgi:hypothetical protein